MRLLRVFAAAALVALLAGSAQAMEVRGQATGPGGPVAGVMVSDGLKVVRTDARGRFRLKTSPGRIVAAYAPGGWRIRGRWWWPAGAAAGRELSITLARAGAGKGEIAFISDPHLRPGLAMKVWRRLCRRLKRLGPELVVVAGDSCFALDKAGKEAPKVMGAVARALALLPGPWAAIPGNHDATYPGGQVNLGLWRKFLGPVRQLRMVGEVAVVMIDNLATARAVGSNRIVDCGATSPQALQWLRSAVGQLPKGAPVVLVSHFPLVAPVAGGPGGLYGGVVRLNNALGLRDADYRALELFRAMSRVRLLAMVHGHLHLPYITRFLARGRRAVVVGLPAVCARWWEGDIRWGPVRFGPGWMQARLRKVHGRWRIFFRMRSLRWAGGGKGRP